MKTRLALLLTLILCAAVIAPTAGADWGSNIVDWDRKLCIDFYGNTVSYAGHSEAYAQLVGSLPVMSYFDGVPCMRRHTYVYSGPGSWYWRRWTGKDYAYTGTLDTNLRVYGEENGWIMIRYPSGTNKGYRYAWTTPEILSAENRRRIRPVEFARIEGKTNNFQDATDDPDVSREFIGSSYGHEADVVMLAFLDWGRYWVYCEFDLETSDGIFRARGFLPADGLRVK